MSPDILLIDINGLGYATMYQPNLSRLAHKGFLTGGIHGALASVFMRMTEMPESTPVVIWDGHTPWRKELDPDYKSNRSDDPGKVAIRNSYALQVPYIQLILNCLGIPQVRCASAEADDVAGVICREIDPSWTIELNSKDGDWWQALNRHISWYSPASRQHVTLASFADPATGLKDGHFLTPWEFLQAKALAGDTSDAIRGIEGVGLKTAAKIMRDNGGDIDTFWSRMDAGGKPKGAKELRVAQQDSRDIYQRNIVLMDWRLAPEMDTADLAITSGQPRWDEVQALTEQFGLSRTLTKARSVIGNGRRWGHALHAVEAALHYRSVQPLQK